MKFFTLPALLAAAFLGLVASLPFLPYAKSRSSLFQLEARLDTSAAGTLQAYYDDGAGYREDLTARTRAEPGPAATPRLAIPAGTYRALRLDPPGHGATILLHSLRVIGPRGRVIADLPLGALQPVQQIASFTVRPDGVEIKTSPVADDPQLHLALPNPLVVRATLGENLLAALFIALPVFSALALLLLIADRAPRLRARAADTLRSFALRPALLVALVAALATAASTYPVLLLGKSYVSPNLGTALLYDQFPTLPGHKDATTSDANGADIGAVMWSHLPLSVIQARALGRDHELPLWNRYNSAGTPLLGQGQSMFGDPLHFLVIAAKGAAWAWDAKYLLAKWLFALALGLLSLALLQDRARPANSPPPLRALLPALLVTVAAPFFGFFLYRLNHPALFSVCYAPWPLYCWLRLSTAATRRARAASAGALLLANLALMNSGTAKEAYMLLLTMNAAGAALVLAAAAPWRQRLVRLSCAAWAGLIFTLLTAPVWGTFLDTLRQAYTGYNAVSAYQIQPTLLLGAFDEAFYRPLMPFHWTFNPSVNFLLLLGLLYFLVTLRDHFAHRATVALALVSLVPLSLAFGLVPPSWIVRVPFLSNVAHIDNTFTCALLILWSPLAAVGFARATDRLRTDEGPRDLAVAALLLGGLVFAWIAFGQASHRPIFGPTFSVNQPGQPLAIPPFLWGYLASLLAAATVFALAARRALLTNRLTPALALLLAGSALALLWRHGFHSTAIGFENFTVRPPSRVNVHAKSDAVEFLRSTVSREPARGFGLHSNFFPGWTALYDLESVHGPDALVNPWLRELVSASGVQRLWDWRIYADTSNVAAARPFLDSLNVRFYLDLQSDQAALGKSLALLKRADLDVYESRTAWPRAFFTDRLARYDQASDFIALLRSGDGRPFAAAHGPDVAADPALARLSPDLSTRAIAPATDYHLTVNTTSFTVRSSGPGLIFLNEAFWPRDFRAELNGRPARVLRLNHALKGLLVETAGEHRVTFRYWPRHFTRNLLLAATGALLLALSAILAFRPKRPA